MIKIPYSRQAIAEIILDALDCIEIEECDEYPLPYFCQRCGSDLRNSGGGWRSCKNEKCRWQWTEKYGWRPRGPGPYDPKEFDKLT